MNKRWVKRIGTKIAEWFSTLKDKSSSKRYNDIFWSLTPKDDLNLQIYERAIDYAFKKKDIHNVAISGAYGAGKSSVIASYKKQHRRLKFMHISLAHYQSIANQDREASVAENALELKILNQLVHQIPARKIPQTGFRVKHPITFWRTLLWTFSLAGFGIALLYVLLFAKWVSFAATLSESLPEYFTPFVEATAQPYARLLALGMCHGCSQATDFSLTTRHTYIERRRMVQGFWHQTDSNACPRMSSPQQKNYLQKQKSQATVSDNLWFLF